MFLIFPQGSRMLQRRKIFPEMSSHPILIWDEPVYGTVLD